MMTGHVLTGTGSSGTSGSGGGGDDDTIQCKADKYT